jgi:hypothetical protein
MATYIMLTTLTDEAAKLLRTAESDKRGQQRAGGNGRQGDQPIRSAGAI